MKITKINEYINSVKFEIIMMSFCNRMFDVLTHILPQKSEMCVTVLKEELMFFLRIVMVRLLCNFLANRNWFLLSGLCCVESEV
jgi:hypothetical protein